MKKWLASSLLVFMMACVFLPVCRAETNAAADLRGETITVYNWGEYISIGEDGAMDVNKAFTERTGINVVYDTFTTNEDLYAKLKSGGASYDVIIPSDYMISKLIEEDMLASLNFENIPNYQYVDPTLIESNTYDPQNKYSVPYTYGRVALVYNKTMVNGTPDSWSALWDPQYKGKILMFDNSRDAFGIAQKLLGYSFNSTNPDEWQAAAEKLKEQKPLVDSYVMDQIFQKMGSGEDALAPYYAGDALTIYDDNPDIGVVIPKEGTNLFIDAMCIPKDSENKAAAEAYINFMCDTQVAYENISYIAYSSPQMQAAELHKEYLLEEYGQWAVDLIYPASTEGTEIFLSLPAETLTLQNDLWLDIRGSDISVLTIVLVVVVLVSLAGAILYLKLRKKRQLS